MMLRNQYWLTRIFYIRYLAFIYFIAFFIAFQQNEILIGDQGLTPASTFLREQGKYFPNRQEAMMRIPTIFWFIEPNSNNLNYAALVGTSLSFLVLLKGYSTFFIQFLLWILYMSIMNVGQTWYSFGWETFLLEIGFLSMFSVPFINSESIILLLSGWNRIDDRFPRWMKPSWIFIWGNRWLLFRLMLGAGLIKIRGDPCWRDLTCMNYHYETQPVPNPLSIFFHHSPAKFHQFETIINHVIELICPWLLLIPERNCQLIGGLIQILFQIILILSGNLSFLNWLTILPALTCLDDDFFSIFFSNRDTKLAIRSERAYREIARDNQDDKYYESSWNPISWLRKEYGYYKFTVPHLLIGIRRVITLSISLLIIYLSYPVVKNLISPNQMMNVSYDSLRIVNSYGMFGSITKVRHEVILEGTRDINLTPNTVWIPFEFRCKPGNINRRPCIISPYHYRIDWLMWFAAFQNYQQCPWLIHIADKLLNGDIQVNQLFDPTMGNPFYNSTAVSAKNISKRKLPTYVRAVLYEYKYAPLFGNQSPEEDSSEWEVGKYWRRKFVAMYFPPIERNNPSVKQFLQAHHMI